MPNRNGSSIYICFIPLQAQFFLNRQVLWRERFVHLDTVHVRQAQIGTFEGLPDSGRGANTHNLRRHTDNPPRDQPRHRFQVVLSHGITRRQHDTGARVIDATGIPWRHHPAFAETRGKFRQCLQGSIPDAFVLCDLNWISFAVLDGNRNDFFRQPARLLGTTRRHLAPQRIGIYLFTRNLILLGQILSSDSHAAANIAIHQGFPQAILQLRGLTQFIACPRAPQYMRRLRHVLSPTGQRNLPFTQQQHLCRVHDSLQARTT